MISCGKMGANASGPTGSRVAGFSDGSSPKGRSGTRLYQLSGRAFSASRNLVDSTKTSGLLAVSHSALQLTGFRTAELCEAVGLAARVHFLHVSCAHPRPGPSGCPREACAPAALVGGLRGLLQRCDRPRRHVCRGLPPFPPTISVPVSTSS